MHLGEEALERGSAFPVADAGGSGALPLPPPLALSHAIDDMVDLAAPDAPVPPSTRSRVLRRVAFLLLTAISLYLVFPSLAEVLSSWRRVRDLHPLWIVGMIALQAASLACLWVLLRIALRTTAWDAVASSQLSGNAFSRLVPGGQAAGAALQYRMLTVAGIDPTASVSALTAVSLLTTATVFAMPLLSLPAILTGTPVSDGLEHSAWLGALAFAFMAGVGVLLLSTTAPLVVIGRAIQGVNNRLRPRHLMLALPERLVAERNAIRRALAGSLYKAVSAAVGRSLFDYLTLLGALWAVGSRPNPSLVLLAYVAAALLAMVPFTPGGLGFVEAGLAATLTLAGITAADAVLATLAYRLVSYWLPLPVGLVAWVRFRRRYG